MKRANLALFGDKNIDVMGLLQRTRRIEIIGITTFMCVLGIAGNSLLPHVVPSVIKFFLSLI